ncbi:uncharacterized protein N7496_003129 [Penicillium cataractarum]|uniref:Oxidoreductase n=1 Tax=Penicillium cataractarum TaxID=2100454 RepID=A0A9W9SLE0_9EURO|nr:uncharacterized protein N7496_003129 [Penicillium cataractarum]KAJ5380701.1 hypothetical protein N7496_003129 [Penicillium cataractarum]
MSSLNFNPDKEIPDLTGKSIFITGGTNGLGAQSAIHLAKHNASHIYISGRNAASAEKIITQIRDTGSKSEVQFIKCDLASLSSVKEAAKQFLSQSPTLDILMCNAGIMAKPPSLTTDGYELQFGTNHLGHALLIKKLLPLLEKTSTAGGDARIVTLTSEGMFLHPKGGIVFDNLKTVQDFWVGGPWRRYGQSKLANMLYAREISRRYPGITSVSVHPGVVSTELVGNSKFMDRALIHITNLGNVLQPEEGAYNQVWAATTPREKLENGMYYEPVGKLAQKKLDKTGRDDNLAKRLWEWTEEALKAY